MTKCTCKNQDRIGFMGNSSTKVFVETIKYGIPLAEKLFCSKCKKELSDEDPRSNL